MLLFGVIAFDADVSGQERSIFVRSFGRLLLLRYFQNLVGLQLGLAGRLVDLGFGRHLVVAAQTVSN